MTAASSARRLPRFSPGAAVGLVVLGGAGVTWGPDLVRDASRGGEADPAAGFLVAVAVVLAICHGCSELLRQLGQPPVLGEILGGLLLGPSALGAVWPAGTALLFPAVVLGHLDRAAQLGLILFMFLLGCELRTTTLRRRRVLVAVVAGSMGLPLLAGAGVALLTGGVLAGAGAPRVAYVLFVGLALAITALPVLGRILLDLGIETTPVGVLALSVAAVGDGLAWAALTLILTLSGATGAGHSSTTAGLAAAFVLVMVLCIRPALGSLNRHLDRREGSDQVGLVVLVIGAIGCAAITELIGLHPVIGAFVFGLAVPRRSAAVQRLSRTMHGVTVAVLLPLFFAGVGLHTSIGLLGSTPAPWLVLGAVLFVAVGSKLVGAGGAARIAGVSAADAGRLGVLMNCRGVTELVVATIGLQHGLIGTLGFTILVLVAVLTTAATSPLLRVIAARSGADAQAAATVGGIRA